MLTGFAGRQEQPLEPIVAGTSYASPRKEGILNSSTACAFLLLLLLLLTSGRWETTDWSAICGA